MSFFNTIMFLMSLIKPLMTLAGLALSFEFVFTLLTPKRTTSGSPLIALLTLLPPCTDLLLTLLWWLTVWTTCIISCIVRSVIYQQKPTRRFVWQQYQLYKRDLQAFATVLPAHERWSRAGLSCLLVLAICGPSNVLMPIEQQYGNGFLPLLPRRSGPAANVTRADQDVCDYLHRCIDHVDAGNVTLFQGPSFLKAGATALQAHCNRVTSPRFRKYGCEIAHWDAGDGKLYLNLHPDDTKAVIDAGWGELHPLARIGAIWTWFFTTFGKGPLVSESLTVIYPPKSTKDVEVVMEMIEAAALFVADPREVFAGECSGCGNHHPSNVKLQFM